MFGYKHSCSPQKQTSFTQMEYCTSKYVYSRRVPHWVRHAFQVQSVRALHRQVAATFTA